MNSLKYLSSKVDKVFGQEEDDEFDAGSFQQVQQIVESIINEEDESSAIDDDDSKLESTESSPLTKCISKIVSFILFTTNLFNPFAYFNQTTSPPSSALSNDKKLAGRNLQSPYVKSHKHSHSSSILSHSPRYLLPPRPLLMRRPQPKTLILDLDETLIHSISQGNKFRTGQMVEVKLDNQLATLYFVNKRPYCDHFLKCVSEWFHLVVFTASVPAYADPMIDWLEQERKYFSRRLYRNHCTATPSGYIKDLAKVESDLSKVVIIDNSPISYSKHNENAISIEGWVSDPSDHNLLNLIPFLHALSYSLDVRSIVSLKMGEGSFE